MFSSAVRSLYVYVFLPMFTFMPILASAGDHNPYPIAEAAIEKYACRACHAFGPQGGGIVGPNLDQVTVRRSEQWLLLWLIDPAAVKPGTLMPKFELDVGEREAIVSYLKQFATPVPSQAIFAEHGHNANAGKALIQAYQCFACHKILNQAGRMIYPDLLTVKERRTAKWEKQWLQDPQLVKPGTFMPTFGFTSEEIDAIVDYLYQ